MPFEATTKHQTQERLKTHFPSNVAGEMFLKGLAPPREIGAEVTLREGRQRLPCPIAAGGRRRLSRRRR